MGDQRFHINQALLHQFDAHGEFRVEAERAAQVQLFRGDCHHGQGHVAAKAQLQDHATRAQGCDTSRKCCTGTGAFVKHIEMAFVGAVLRHGLRVFAGVDDAVRTDLCSNS